MCSGNVDLSEQKFAAEAAAATLRPFGRIDALMHTVGAPRGGALMPKQTKDDGLALERANFASPLNASRAAHSGEAALSACRASKAAVARQCECMTGVATLKWCFNCVVPGTLNTPRNPAATPGADSTTWIQPGDVARVISLLVSCVARALSGRAICS